jgi:hypothetical protein
MILNGIRLDDENTESWEEWVSAYGDSAPPPLYWFRGDTTSPPACAPYDEVMA